jgi:hypothetical protein
MDTYEWRKNEAVVKRLYYIERTWETTLVGSLIYTMANMHFVRQNYFRATMASRLAPIWFKVIGFNTLISLILIAPLTRDEIRVQVGKRLVMGKWLYSTYHLDEEHMKHAPTRIF